MAVIQGAITALRIDLRLPVHVLDVFLTSDHSLRSSITIIKYPLQPDYRCIYVVKQVLVIRSLNNYIDHLSQPLCTNYLPPSYKLPSCS